MLEAAAPLAAGSAGSTVTPPRTWRQHVRIDDGAPSRGLAAARVAMALYRMEMGNLSNAKGVGGGVLEYRIDFGRDGDALITLLGGGTKARQQRDIEEAVALWREYRRSKRKEG